MLKIENFEVIGWEHAIRGMRNPMNSWEKSDSGYCVQDLSRDCNNCVHKHTNYPTCRCDGFDIGQNDYALMKKLRNAGTDHRKFMRMITVYLDITAPLYWWKEFKTYRAGRKFGDPEPDIINPELLEMDIETNSCSTMHKIAAKEFTLEDFSCEHLNDDGMMFDVCEGCDYYPVTSLDILKSTIGALNYWRRRYLVTKNKDDWWQMIQLLPISYNQKRTVMLNYEVLANIYESRKNHKLDEWRTFCHWIDELPYSELITGYEEE